eukprot:TRINITY_DN11693_c0_g2_i1.p2 TRINITY_DN11693_c0_g2~~TRINITY_DN11693_c0_g2_i1.p2  ORF type:complete len:188 (-),score=46.79 TRINITY_DN11693_c0_g2_i1:540-1103(-)
MSIVSALYRAKDSLLLECCCFFFFFKQKTAYEMQRGLVGSEMCIRDRYMGEIFLMPSKRMKKYWEIIVGCDESIFEGFHCSNKYGGFVSDSNASVNGLQFKSLRKKDGYVTEVAIPFSELPNYMLGNAPKSGESIYFALVRTDKKKGEKVKFYSSFPLLYGGHNVYGHAKAILTIAENKKDKGTCND